jgi:hypothetical protein
MRQNVTLSAGVAASVLTSPEVAEAYIGPGAGITVIGTDLALVGAIALGIVGLVWYPVKSLRARLRGKRNLQRRDQDASPSLPASWEEQRGCLLSSRTS